MVEWTGGAIDEIVAAVVVVVIVVVAENDSAAEGDAVAFLVDVVATVEARALEADVDAVLTPRDFAFPCRMPRGPDPVELDEEASGAAARGGAGEGADWSRRQRRHVHCC